MLTINQSPPKGSSFNAPAIYSSTAQRTADMQAIAAFLVEVKHCFYVYCEDSNSLYGHVIVRTQGDAVHCEYPKGRRTYDVVGDIPGSALEETDYSLLPGCSVNRAETYVLGRDMSDICRLMSLPAALRIILQSQTGKQAFHPVILRSEITRLEKGNSTGLQLFHLHLNRAVPEDNSTREALRREMRIKLSSYLVRHGDRQSAGVYVD